MQIDNFLHYLKYQECKEVEAHRHSYYVYESPTGKRSTITAKQDDLHPYDVVLICIALQIPIPERVEYTSIYHRLKSVWKDI